MNYQKREGYWMHSTIQSVFSHFRFQFEKKSRLRAQSSLSILAAKLSLYKWEDTYFVSKILLNEDT